MYHVFSALLPNNLLTTYIHTCIYMYLFFCFNILFLYGTECRATKNQQASSIECSRNETDEMELESKTFIGW